MANFKLNSVLVATESGGTVTVDSAVTGIPAAGVTGTLPNAVQDNVTRLGTVTTGTMDNTIGSSATFPAGHVIRTTYSKENTATGHTDTSSTSEVATGLIITTPPTTGSNYNIITMSFNGYTYANQNNNVYLYCNKNGAGYSKVTGGASSAGMHHYYNSHRRIQCMWIDNQAGLTAGNNLYQLYFKTDTGTFYLIHVNYDWHWMVQEVQA